ncbi:hypothetical protein H632_c355p0 [Helicosporidium sp. ATCC 50920]|nr:hypothetical protein H632_c355p0 [Helicosporidium sp. ATCC 50920]|eukprot:KDD76102.1 hypothetical protein H632_c355p0 [Helicosporidium sp. ATCC 50920]
MSAITSGRASLLAWAVPLLLACACHGLETYSLDTKAYWELDNMEGFDNVTLRNVRVPNVALTSLLDAGVVSDPLYRYNEILLRWVAEDIWSWTARFVAPASLLAERRQMLEFRGLQTSASMYLNDHLLGTASNAHHAHHVDVTGLLLPGSNTLIVTIQPSVAYGREQAEAYPYSVPFTRQLGALPNYNFVRQAAADFGWDWGPAFAPTGITGPVTLVGYSAAFARTMGTTQVFHLDESVTLTVDAVIFPAEEHERGNLTLELYAPPEDPDEVGVGEERGMWDDQEPGAELVGEGGVEEEGAEGGAPQPTSAPPTSRRSRPPNTARVAVSVAEIRLSLNPKPCAPNVTNCAHVSPSFQRVRLDVTAGAPIQLWYPWDQGAQPMYTVRLTYAPATVGGDPEAARKHASVLERRVGFRQVVLNTGPLVGRPSEAKRGELFAFEINGKRIFARGANWIPADIAQHRIPGASFASLIRAARGAGMNMLRVWGGGRYEREELYAAADRAGMLIWQEAAFACALYPRDAAFLASVREEISGAFARLSPHASVVVWGANNENENAMDWLLQRGSHREGVAVDYVKLAVDTVRDELLRRDPHVLFLDTSPSNGVLSKEPYIKRWGPVNSNQYGDVHFYNYQADLLDPRSFPQARFVSEFGFQSLPSFSALEKVTEPRDWALRAPMTAFRLRHARGLQEMIEQMTRHFLKKPPALKPTLADPATSTAAIADIVAAALGKERAGKVLYAEQSAVAKKTVKASRILQHAGQWGHNATHRMLAEQRGAPALEDALRLDENDAERAPDGESIERGQVPVDGDSLSDIYSSPNPSSPPPPLTHTLLSAHFQAFIYLSQLQQALVYAAAVGTFRRARHDDAVQTAGALYWQLNDIWPGASWSGINHHGGFKLLHHAAKTFFAPVGVHGWLTEQGLPTVTLSNELSLSVQGQFTVHAVPYAARGAGEAVRVVDALLTAGADSSSDVWKPTQDEVERLGDPATYFLRFRFVPRAVRSPTGASMPLFGLCSSWVPVEDVQSPELVQVREDAELLTKQTVMPAASWRNEAAASALHEQGNVERDEARVSGPEDEDDRKDATAAPGNGNLNRSPASGTLPARMLLMQANSRERHCSASPRLTWAPDAARCTFADAVHEILRPTQNVLSLKPYRDSELAFPDVRAKVSASVFCEVPQKGSDGQLRNSTDPAGFDIVLTTNHPALFAHVELGAALRVSGNLNASGVLVLPWEPVVLRFLYDDRGKGVRSASAPGNASEDAWLHEVQRSVRVHWLQKAVSILDDGDGQVKPGSGAGSFHAAAALRWCLGMQVLILFTLFG